MVHRCPKKNSHVYVWSTGARSISYACRTRSYFLIKPDYGSLIIIGATGLCMLTFAGAQWKHILSLIVVGSICAALVVFFVPYVGDRVDTFIHPGNDPLGAGYQINQSLIAVGSGQITGRGFGQSVQKFNFLPEPMGDSVFASVCRRVGFCWRYCFSLGFLLLF